MVAGRDVPLAELSAAVDAALAGRGGAVLLAGEAGIGKTAAAEHAADLARGRGARVLWAACWQGAGVPGYWPWVQVVRGLLALGGGRAARLALDAPSLARLVPELAGPPRPGTPPAPGAVADPAPGAVVPDQGPPAAAPAARFQLFDELAGALLAEARAAPLVVVLDDLHWADPPSLELLDFLTRRLHGARLLVVGTWRDAEVGPGDPLAPLLAGLAGRAAVLPLAPLDDHGVGRVMAGILGRDPPPELAAAVRRRTGGNPFFVQQVTRLLAARAGERGGVGGAAAAGIPPGVGAAIEQRLERLDAPLRELVRAAAVAGPEVSPALLARVTGRPAAEVADLLAGAVRARVLSGPAEPPGPYRFAHDLFRETVDAGLDGATRARLHLAVARALEAERAAGGEVSPPRLAHHFAQAVAAGGAGQAQRYLALAARDAGRRQAHEEAARHWRRSLELLEAAGTAAPPRGEVLIELGEALRRAGDLAAARQAHLRALELARRDGDAGRLARAALGLHAVGSASWPPRDELVEVLEEAAAALSGRRTALAARVLAALARELAWNGRDVERARPLARRAVAAARHAGDQATLAACLLAQHNVVWGPGSARERLALAAEILARAGDREAAVEARLLRVADLLELADPAVHAELAAFLRAAEALRQPRARYTALSRRAMLALLQGRLDDAERLIGEAAALGAEMGEPDAPNVCSEQLWALRAAQGRLSELREQLLAAFPQDTVQGRWYLVMSLLEEGDREGAEAAARSFGALDEGAVPRDRSWTDGLTRAAEVAAELRERRMCERLHRLLLPHATDAATVGAAVCFRGAVAFYLGLLAAALDRHGDARDHFEQALAVHERLGAHPWALRTRYELACLPADTGGAEAAAADRALADVAAAAGRLGMAALAQRAAERRRRAGQATVAEGAFLRDGRDWALAWGGTTARMPDAKGLHDIAALLRAPGRPVHAADLLAASGERDGRAAAQLGADEVLDRRALRELRARLADLDEEAAEAERWHDAGRAARAGQERDALLAELRAAVGLGGRPRRLGDPSERARKAVTARIRHVLGRIDAVHPALAGHLRASLQTGTFCTYAPASPVRWRL